MEKSPYREVWVEIPDGQSMCALINGEWGWLMYLRYKGDAGFSSRNIKYKGPAESTIEYRLDNGQHDEYPASWAYPVAVIEHALQFFQTQQIPPTFIHWHNDSEDGAELEYKTANNQL
ncbi:Imm1 family immunity protein [Ectopseudomonas khazarica]|uniref:Imm1 family immunity protein n=1 Tax=Ectopseudomonas khazarica TaxID=2502979 RepID=A0ABW7MBI7_9GAMM